MYQLFVFMTTNNIEMKNFHGKMKQRKRLTGLLKLISLFISFCITNDDSYGFLVIKTNNGTFFTKQMPLSYTWQQLSQHELLHLSVPLVTFTFLMTITLFPFSSLISPAAFSRSHSALIFCSHSLLLLFLLFLIGLHVHT